MNRDGLNIERGGTLKRKLSKSYHKVREHDELQPIITEREHCEKEAKGPQLQSFFCPKKNDRRSSSKVSFQASFLEDIIELKRQLEAEQINLSPFEVSGSLWKAEYDKLQDKSGKALVRLECLQQAKQKSKLASTSEPKKQTQS